MHHISRLETTGPTCINTTPFFTLSNG